MTASRLRPDPSWLRLSWFYTAYFAVIGVLLPYWPVWLTDQGLSPVAVGTVLAVGFWIKPVAQPVVAALADSRGALRGAAILMAAASIAAFAGYAVFDGLPAYLLLAALAGATFQTILPLAEALALAETKARGLDFGRIRIGGSVAFVLAALAGGALIERFGSGVVLVLVLAGLAATVSACVALPRRTGVERAPWSWRRVADLVVDRRFLLFVAAAGLIQASHGVYYGFGTVIWRDLGFSESLIGGLWTVGVVAEIALFWWAGRMGRLGTATGLMALGALGALVRWPLMPLADTPALAGALQLLHGLTFGAAYLGAMRYLQETARPGLEATAQALYSALVSGAIMGLVMPASGLLYERLGIYAYPAMGGLGVLSLCAILALARVTSRGRPPPA